MPRLSARGRKFATQCAKAGDCTATARPSMQKLAAKATALTRKERRLQTSAGQCGKDSRHDGIVVTGRARTIAQYVASRRRACAVFGRVCASCEASLLPSAACQLHGSRCMRLHDRRLSNRRQIRRAADHGRHADNGRNRIAVLDLGAPCADQSFISGHERHVRIDEYPTDLGRHLHVEMQVIGGAAFRRL